jgi:hypothetical protein
MSDNYFQKAVVFTDAHFGRSGDSIIANQDNLEFIRWMIDRARSWGAETCLFLGDFYHNRSAIGVSSLNAALTGLEMLSAAGFDRVTFLKGNHDLARRQTREISSLNFAKHLDKITLINEPIVLDGVALLPWLVEDELALLPHLKARYAFGHFETIGAMMNARVACTGGHNAVEADVFTKQEHTFCFPADVTVVCADGVKPIAKVSEGDFVLTHKNRWRRVIKTASRTSETIELHGNGHPRLRVTRDHPFFVLGRGRANSRPLSQIVSEGHAEWVAAGDMKDCWWSSPIRVDEHLALPELPSGLDWNEDFATFLGWYLAEGHTWNSRTVSLSCHLNEYIHVAGVLSRVSRCGYKIAEARTGENGRTASIYHPNLALWLDSQIGRYAENITVPGWVFSLPVNLQEILLRAYVDGDGCDITPQKWETKSVSKGLSVGIKLLAQMLGWRTTLFLRPAHRATFPGGRTYDCREQWRVRAYKETARWGSAFRTPHFQCGRVRKLKETVGVETVYNLSVEEDESYVADGIVVHNCGHFHQRQSLKNITYLGNIMPFDFSDANDPNRGAMFLEWGKDPFFESWPEQPLYQTAQLSWLLDNLNILKPKMTVRATVDMPLQYEEAQEIRETLVKSFDLRKVELVNVAPLAPEARAADQTLYTVDEIIIDSLQHLESGEMDNARLVEIFNSLPRA